MRSASSTDQGSMVATRKKLREARFFYDLLVSAEGQIMKQQGDEASDFYLSAFLTAARSVFWVLEVEEKKRFRPWYRQWKKHLTPAEQSTWVFHVGQRSKSVHARGAETRAAATSVPVQELQMELARRGGAAYFFGGAVGAEPPTTTRTSLKFPTRTTIDVATSCRTFLDLVSKLVGDFEQHLSGEVRTASAQL